MACEEFESGEYCSVKLLEYGRDDDDEDEKDDVDVAPRLNNE